MKIAVNKKISEAGHGGSDSGKRAFLAYSHEFDPYVRHIWTVKNILVTQKFN